MEGNTITHINDLNAQERDALLSSLAVPLENSNPTAILTVLFSSHVLLGLAKAIDEHVDWIEEAPDWTYTIIRFHYIVPKFLVSKDQTLVLAESIATQLDKSEMSNKNYNAMLKIIFDTCHGSTFVNSVPIRKMLHKYVCASEGITRARAFDLLISLTDGDDSWQLSILKDMQLIQTLLMARATYMGDPLYWRLLANITQHEEAKIWLPTDFDKFTREGAHPFSNLVHANLADDVSHIEVDEHIAEQIAILRQILKDCIDAVQLQHISYNLIDLLLPIIKLSVQDTTKELLVACKVVELLLDFLKLEEAMPLNPRLTKRLPKLKLLASEALWNLAFNASTCHLIKKLHAVEMLQHLHDKLPNSNDTFMYKMHLNGICSLCTIHPTPPQGKHILISYHRVSLGKVKILAKELKTRGYRIYFNLEKSLLQGNDASATAVEESSIVLMCMSKSYKDSAQCHYEGHYAVQRKTEVIPILVQPQYTPDGWVGLLQGKKQTYDFSDERKFAVELPKLIAALGDRCRDTSKPIAPNPKYLHSSHTPAPQKRMPYNFESTKRILEEKKKFLTNKLQECDDIESMQLIYNTVRECDAVITLLNQ